MSLCTMFVFEGVDDPNLLHCTHRYYPDDSSVSEKQVLEVLRAYFREKPFKPFKVKFDQLVAMGTEGDYRAVTTDRRDCFLPALKERLDELEPDKWPEYKPHVTVGRNTDELNIPIRDYVLMKDHKLVWSARANGAQRRLSMVEADDQKKQALEKETRDDLGETGGQKLDAFNAALDSIGTGPRMKTPLEMRMNPADFLDEIDPAADQKTQAPAPQQQSAGDGSGGPRSWGINDNGAS